MSQPIGKEAIEYERYVDGLRSALRACAEYIEGCATRNEVSWKLLADNQVLVNAKKALGIAPFQKVVAEAKPINIHIEGGLVQDVTGIPENFEVHVYDHDAGDVFHPSWDAEKECFVTVYGGGGA